ncbi:4-(cytidine 5'-diphospho)-2-C-methyl-D-erythritol kinase [Euzebya sp.]|uniref:4-(cytidine 5'-diphospho)-2-C-methyl-D-erythritol kinase n=1 Tax=Euzebya sp. TaxID=1971409 RepID=UPI0035172D69
MPQSQPSPTRIQVRVPAKINPFLAVRGVREDGYHELSTVFQTVALSDTLTMSVMAAEGRMYHPTSGGRVAVHFSHDGGAGVPAGDDNLVVRAATLLADRIGLRLQADAPIRTLLALEKRIPVAGGMAGGSADAAAALLGLNELWGGDLSRRALLELAADLGADVPFCLVGGTALATGTGSATAGVLCRGSFHWVACTADEELATPAVYAAWDDHCEPGEQTADDVLAAVAAGDPERLGPALHNDLQPAAEVLMPRLRADRRALLDAGALGAVVSGSGPTLLALAADQAEAHRIAGRVAGRFADVLITRSPAGGPVLSAG